MVFKLIDELVCLKKAHGLALVIYKVTKDFPKEESYGLTSQLRRAAVSVPANIAEGKSRGSDRDFIRFLLISRASLTEVRYLLLLSRDLQLLSMSQYEACEASSEEVSRVLSGVIAFLSRNLKVKRRRSSED